MEEGDKGRRYLLKLQCFPKERNNSKFFSAGFKKIPELFLNIMSENIFIEDGAPRQVSKNYIIIK